MFLLYSTPLWNKSRVVALVHQALPDLDPIGSALISYHSSCYFYLSCTSLSPDCGPTSMIPPQGIYIRCSHYMEYLPHMYVHCPAPFIMVS